MPTSTLLARPSTDRTQSAVLALSSMSACAVIALVDPGTPGRYPVCPTRALFGIDCPACGTLRGLHALSRGHLAAALDHNVLLLAAVPLGMAIWWRWVLIALGRPVRPVTMPGWAMPAMAVVAVIFTVARNLPIHGLIWLNSA